MDSASYWNRGAPSALKDQEKEQTPAQWARETLEKAEEKKDPPRPRKRDEYVTEWAL